jgi:AmmeMemoRadiSam system protein B
MSIRKSVVSGSFYPDNKKELLHYFEKFNKTKDDKNSFKNINAIIVPHAGYIYSGFTANKAYKIASLNNYIYIFKTIFIIFSFIKFFKIIQ